MTASVVRYSCRVSLARMFTQYKSKSNTSVCIQVRSSSQRASIFVCHDVRTTRRMAVVTVVRWCRNQFGAAVFHRADLCLNSAWFRVGCSFRTPGAHLTVCRIYVQTVVARKPISRPLQLPPASSRHSLSVTLFLDVIHSPRWYRVLSLAHTSSACSACLSTPCFR